VNIPSVEIEDHHIDGKCVDDGGHVGSFEIKMRNIEILIFL
jgi:hypothetical protein